MCSALLDAPQKGLPVKANCRCQNVLSAAFLQPGVPGGPPESGLTGPKAASGPTAAAAAQEKLLLAKRSELRFASSFCEEAKFGTCDSRLKGLDQAAHRSLHNPSYPKVSSQTAFLTRCGSQAAPNLSRPAHVAGRGRVVLRAREMSRSRSDSRQGQWTPASSPSLPSAFLQGSVSRAGEALNLWKSRDQCSAG